MVQGVEPSGGEVEPGRGLCLLPLFERVAVKPKLLPDIGGKNPVRNIFSGTICKRRCHGCLVLDSASFSVVVVEACDEGYTK